MVGYVNFSKKKLQKVCIFQYFGGHLLATYSHLSMKNTQKDRSNPEKIPLFSLFSSLFLLLQKLGGRHSNFLFLAVRVTLFVTLWHQLPALENLHFLAYYLVIVCVFTNIWHIFLIRKWLTIWSALWPCHTLTHCFSVCRHVWIFTNTVVYAETSYEYVWHK